MDKEKVFVPPIKIQGIKTKLVPFIKQNLDINKNTIWIEPFMGSGVVGFNLAPEKAVFSDINPHIINFYNCIKSGKITSYIVRGFLEEESQRLINGDIDYYYTVRERFNKYHEPLDFLFLNRSCFNGMIRFNKNNEFNVPYCHKAGRFSKAYITKIVNQVKFIEEKIYYNDWQFICQSFDKTLLSIGENTFIYCDPPYIGRNVDYFDSWNEKQEILLCDLLKKSNAKFMVSTWDHNKFRQNMYIEKLWGSYNKIMKEHYYHVGGKIENRNSVTEALIINYNNISKKQHNQISNHQQLTLHL